MEYLAFNAGWKRPFASLNGMPQVCRRATLLQDGAEFACKWKGRLTLIADKSKVYLSYLKGYLS
jgi:hypothetical protein